MRDGVLPHRGPACVVPVPPEPEPPLQGRSWELLLAERFLLRVQRGRGGVLVVTGPSGAGKSRFVTEVARRARSLGLATRTLGPGEDLPAEPSLPPVVDAGDPAHSALAELEQAGEVMVVDGIEQFDPDTRAALMDLSYPGVTGNVLLVLTLTTGEQDSQPRPLSSARQWLRRRGVSHLHLVPLADGDLGRLVLGALPHGTWDEAQRIVGASRGNPGLALDLCRWADAAASRSDGTIGPWLRAAVSGWAQLVAVPHLLKAPADAELVARALDRHRSSVVHELEEAVAAGLLQPAPGRPTAFEPTHEAFGAVAVRLGEPDITPALRKRLAVSLLSLPDRGSSAGSELVADHLYETGDRGERFWRWALRAAARSAAVGDAEAAQRFARRVLECRPDSATALRATLLDRRWGQRSGDRDPAGGSLDDVLTLARSLGDDDVVPQVVLEILDAELVADAGRELDESKRHERLDLLIEALWMTRTPSPETRARLQAHQAVLMMADGPAGARRAADAALDVARGCGDVRAMSFAASVRSVEPVPHDVDEYVRLAAETAGLPGSAAWGGARAMAYVALATGRRHEFDSLADRWQGLAGTDEELLLGPPVDLLRAGGALLALDEARLATALEDLAVRAPAVASSALPFAAMLWRVQTGRRLGWPNERAPQLPPPTDRSSSLLALADLALAPAGDRPGYRRLALALSAAPSPDSVPADGQWAAYQAVLARAGAVVGSPDHCRRAVRALRPFADQFVVLGSAIPFGPVGWFLASAYAHLGDADAALVANAQAEDVSRSLLSPGWISLCQAQRARLMRSVAATDDEAGRAGALEAAGVLRPRAAHRLRGALPASGEPAWESAGADLDERPVDPGFGRRAGAEPVDDLTPLEVELLRHVADGRTNAVIAKRLHTSVPTVERRLTALYRRLGVKNRAQAVSVINRRAEPDPARAVRPVSQVRGRPAGVDRARA